MPSLNEIYSAGLFAESHMSFNVDRKDTEEGEPTLAEMVTTALKVLQGQDDRYFLMVEAGRIDHAHHYNNAYRALDDTLALDDAVSIILNSSLISSYKISFLFPVLNIFILLSSFRSAGYTPHSDI